MVLQKTAGLITAIFINSGSNGILVNGSYNTIRNCKIEGAFQKGVNGNGYGISCTGKYILMTGNTVKKVRHWAIQQGAEYCVVYNNHSETDINFHQKDKGKNLVEKNKIHIPFYHPWNCFQAGASFHGDPGENNMFF